MSDIHRFAARPFGRGAAIVTLALVATATLGSAPVGAATSGPCTSGPVLDLANPSAGDLLSPGDYVVSGVARDPAAPSGDGIDRIELFLGNRDLGGTEVGTAIPQQGMFAVTAKLPTSISGGTNFFAYAHSAVSGQEVAVSVPVFLGAAPTPTPRPAPGVSLTPGIPAVAQVSCAPAISTLPTGPLTTGASSAPAAAAPVVMSVAPSVAPVLQVANPNANDTLLLGDYIISGLAYVPGQTGSQGVGVNRVDFFLGNRDAGGVFLGSAVPGQSAELNAAQGSLLAMGGFVTKVTVPSQIHGGTTFFAYATNSITGQESVVSVPVFVGAAPTPTPRPSTSS
ncbi:MAG TPA: hypothetical protein VKV73_00785 [Chloroflexota bacterium]|nr:hypothetical protein [Chloroflexota bacterium]